jgi:hypothetical protein
MRNIIKKNPNASTICHSEDDLTPWGDEELAPLTCIERADV